MDIVDTLLERVHMGAALSLEPLLALLGTLARDLQADFLPCLPRILSSFSQLVDEGTLSPHSSSPFPSIPLRYPPFSLFGS